VPPQPGSWFGIEKAKAGYVQWPSSRRPIEAQARDQKPAGKALYFGYAVSLHKTPWTDEENERLRRLASSGVSIFRAAATLKRKTGSIRTQARKISCPFPTIKEMRLKSSHSPDGQQR
jgi:hypothetical protein